jgi:hypothetical protein
MDDGAQVGIVEIENVRADAVHQRRVQHVQTIFAAEHRCLRGPGMCNVLAAITALWASQR